MILSFKKIMTSKIVFKFRRNDTKFIGNQRCLGFFSFDVVSKNSMQCNSNIMF